jgi:hypothetical protein
VAVATKRVDVDGDDDRFVTAVVGVRGVVGDEAALVGLDVVGAVARGADDEQAVAGLSVANGRPWGDGVSVTEGRTGRGRRDERPTATDRTDGGSLVRRRDATGGHVEGDPTEVFTACPAELMVRTGTRVGFEVDDVRGAVGLHGVSAVAKGANDHRLGAGAPRPTGRARGGERRLRPRGWQ